MSHRREKLVALATELASDFATRAAEHDRNNSFPFENIARLKETGYSALVIPEANGGLGADLEDYVLCQEQLAQGCGATTIAINMHLFGLGSMVERSTVQRPEEKLFLDAIGHGKQIIGGGISEPETGGDWGLLRDQGAQGRRQLRPQRAQDLHQPLAGDRFVHGDGDHRGFQSARALDVSHSQGHAGTGADRNVGRDGDARNGEPRPGDQGRAWCRRSR